MAEPVRQAPPHFRCQDRGSWTVGALSEAWKEQGEKGKGRLGWAMQGHSMSPLLVAWVLVLSKGGRRGQRRWVESGPAVVGKVQWEGG